MNSKLRRAKSTKNDEFYTLLEDIEKEMEHYARHLKGKTIYCNCDTERSNFVKYFRENGKALGIKKLLFSGMEADGEGTDYRSPEALAMLSEADIVVTNPPFSKFRDFVMTLMKHKKDFIIIGNFNAVSYSEIFPLIRGGKVKLATVPGVTWYTTFAISKHREELKLAKEYRPEDFPHYDNYDAIEVSRVANIPRDFEGIMGVPISYLTKHNPKQFEILGSHRWAKSPELMEAYTGDANPPESDLKTTIKGRETYSRIFIRRRK